jgi:hypothetical protein
LVLSKIIELPCYGIKIEIGKDGCGILLSTGLHEDYISDDTGIDAMDINEENARISIYNAMMDAIESLILGHAIAGVDVTTPAYLEGIESAIEGINNNL